MNTISIASAALGALLLASSAGAVTPPGPLAQSDVRYAFERAGDGFARMDKTTGEVSFCRMEAAGLVCRLAADDRHAYEARMESLARENADLKARMAYGTPPGRPAPLAQKKMDAGDEIDLATYIVKRLIHAARDIKDEVERAEASGDDFWNEPYRAWR